MTHQISIAEADALIARFLANKSSILSGGFSTRDPFTNCQTFEMSSVLSVLGQSGTRKLRAYFGMYGDDENVPDDKVNKIVLVLCSVDEEDNDLNLGANESGSIILEDAYICPTYCPAPSQINNL